MSAIAPALGSAPQTAREALVQRRACAGCNLRGNDLSGLNLQGASLPGANLSHAVVTWADLRGADLRGADLRYAYLWGADLTGALLEGTLLCGAVMPNGSTSSVGCSASAATTTAAVPMAMPTAAPMAMPTAPADGGDPPPPMAQPMGPAGGNPPPPIAAPATGFGPAPRQPMAPTALALNLDQAFTTVRDRLAPGEQDIWQVNATTGRINALVLSPDLGVRLSVVTPSGETRARFRQRQLSVEVPAPGRYDLRVDNSGSLTDYQLALTFDPVLETAATATAMAAPASVGPRALSLDPLTQMGMVTTAIAAGERQEWLMDGRRGSVEIQLITTDPTLRFDLMGHDGRHLARQTQRQVVRLPRDGQYRLIIEADEEASTYELRVRRL
ncbi:MAG: hypothetical protein Fur0042_26700 [Cyanophyceae cyanobacterium]